MRFGIRNSFLVLAFFFLFLPSVSLAHNPRVIETPGQNDVMPLPTPAISQAIYGNLEGYPHMFEFATTKEIELFTEVLVPDIEGARDNVSGIILRVNSNRSVTDVARLRAREASWETFFEPWGGDSYKRGSSFRHTIEPGLYRIEVSTPDNIGKYVLAVGTGENFAGTGYFALVRELIEVKKFFGKSPWRVVESPFVYGPLMLLLVLGLVTMWYLRGRTAVRGSSVLK